MPFKHQGLTSVACLRAVQIPTMESFPRRLSSSTQATLRSDKFKYRYSELHPSYFQESCDDVLLEKDENLVSISTESADQKQVKHPVRCLTGETERPRKPTANHLPSLDQSLFKTDKNKAKTRKSPEKKKKKTTQPSLLAGEYHLRREDYRTYTGPIEKEKNVLDASKLFRHESNSIFPDSEQRSSYCDMRKRNQDLDILGNVENSQVTSVDYDIRENRSRDHGRRRRFKPASGWDIAQAGGKIPFPPDPQRDVDIQSGSVSCNELQRNIHESYCDNIHKELVAQNGETGTNGTKRRRKVNLVAVMYLQATQQASAEVKIPLPRRRVQSKVFPSTVVIRKEFQEEQGESCCIQNQENEDRYDDEQVYLPLPPSHHVRRETSNSKRIQRMAVCEGAESTGLLKERMLARVLLKRFGDLNISNASSHLN